jgi:hypothetical protein
MNYAACTIYISFYHFLRVFLLLHNVLLRLLLVNTINLMVFLLVLGGGIRNREAYIKVCE